MIRTILAGCPLCKHALVTSGGGFTVHHWRDRRENQATGEVRVRCAGCNGALVHTGGRFTAVVPGRAAKIAEIVL